MHAAEKSKPSKRTEAPAAHSEQESASAQATSGLGLAALSHIRDSLRQQLKMRKQRAADEPFDLATGSPEAIEFPGQRTALVEMSAPDTSARSAGDGSRATRREVALSPEEEAPHHVSHRFRAAQGLKDEKLVCLEFCQCVCLSEEPVVSHTHTATGMPVCGGGLSNISASPFSLFLLS